MANGLIQTTNDGARRQMLAQLLSGELGGNNNGPRTGMEAAGQIAQNYMLAQMLGGGTGVPGGLGGGGMGPSMGGGGMGPGMGPNMIPRGGGF